MKTWLCLATVLLCACAEPPRKPSPPPEPLTGRQAYQQTFAAARTWSSDCQPIRIRSFNLQKPKSEDGKAGAWEIMYVSEKKGRALSYTWSAVEAEGLHQGVFAGHEEPWKGPQGQERPFLTTSVKIDTPEALRTAVEKSESYLSKPGLKPQVNFMLESTPRFPDPAWRIFWGNSVSSAEWSVFIDATLGIYLGR